jgi:hypothetical protein
MQSNRLKPGDLRCNVEEMIDARTISHVVLDNGILWRQSQLPIQDRQSTFVIRDLHGSLIHSWFPFLAAMSLRTPSIHSQDDPLTVAIRPPPTETPHERNARLQREQEARRISDEIDEEIRKERERLKKSKEDVKVCTIKQSWIAYTHNLPSLDPIVRTSRVWKIHLAKTVQIAVQTPRFRNRTFIMEKCVIRCLCLAMAINSVS